MSETPTVETTADDTPTYADWRYALEEGTLLGCECQNCGHVTGTPKRLCGQCGSDRLTERQLPTTGRVYTETTIGVSPAGFDAPYQIAVVDLDGTHVLARVDGDVEIGASVTLSGTIVTDDRPAPVFEPTE